MNLHKFNQHNINNIFVHKSKSKIKKIISTYNFEEKYNLLVSNRLYYARFGIFQKFTNEISNIIPQRFKVIVGWSNFPNVFSDLTKKEYKKIESLVEQYLYIFLQTIK